MWNIFLCQVPDWLPYLAGMFECWREYSQYLPEMTLKLKKFFLTSQLAQASWMPWIDSVLLVCIAPSLATWLLGVNHVPGSTMSIPDMILKVWIISPRSLLVSNVLPASPHKSCPWGWLPYWLLCTAPFPRLPCQQLSMDTSSEQHIQYVLHRLCRAGQICSCLYKSQPLRVDQEQGLPFQLL